MTFQEKIDLAIDEMQLANVKPYRTNMLRYRILAALGIQAPPPYYRVFPLNVLSHFVKFALIYGGFMWLLAWKDIPEMTASMMITNTSLVSLFYGMMMASYIRFEAKRKKLTPWHKLLSPRP